MPGQRNNPPAFPLALIVDGEEGPEHWNTPGMSLRDYFAGQALANPAICKHDDEYPHRTAYSFADVMLEQRKKGGE